MQLALPNAESVGCIAAPADSFDYGALAPADAAKLREVAEAIRSHGRRIGRNIIAVGVLLLAVKQGLPHGGFGAWLATEFAWNERTAQRYMQAAEAFGSKTDTVSELPATMIYQLSAPSTPAPVRLEVVERLERGERLTVDAIRYMVADARQTVKREREIAKLPARRQKAIRQDAEERAASQAKWERERERQVAARLAAARLIVTKFGGQLPELLQLLKAASHPGLYASDIEAAATTAAA